MKKIDKKFFIRFFLIVVGVAAFIAAASRLSSIEKEQKVSTAGYSYEKARVTEVTVDNLTEEGYRVGYQQLLVEILTGDQKGQILEATSSEGNLYGAICAEGDTVIVTIAVSGDNATVSVYSKDRSFQVGAFVAIFLLLICVIGGKNGVKSVIGLAFTGISIVYLLFPMMYIGISPFWSAILICALTTIVTMLLIGGFTRKTICAIVGTVIGVLMAGLSAWLFGLAADIDGYNVSNIETLIYVEQVTSIKVGELLFAAILIAALGAVMDVAMSVSSAICEIHVNSPDLNSRKLFASGMNVGRDMMGTMSNTLILAFVGSSLSTLLLDYTYDLPLRQLINSYNIGIEIMQGISGSIGVILAVPATAAVTAVLIGGKGTQKMRKSGE
ncbi:MAG: YibE/F family protein [Clostridiales bacterium]|nr:YibE/F family protein [Clostridiales bacterium]